ncbi:MAG TPA: alpha/beta hydrolase [Verrucomicrobiae bacterium]
MKERKPIDPELRRYLDELARQAESIPATLINEARVRLARTSILKALENRGPIPGLPNSVETGEIAISGALAARLYTPAQASITPLPVLVYLHGGGWVVGSVATHDPFCRLLCEAAELIIASVGYRLAPEHRYPAGLEDTLTAIDWVTKHAAEWGGNPAQLLLGGDSAGANLAAVAANQLCTASAKTPLCALMLLYPVTDHPNANHPSYTENGTSYGLGSDLMRWFWGQYAPGIAPDDPGISPLQLQRIPALPPTLVATAEYDPLRDEGVAYAEKLKAAGIDTTHIHAADMNHNFAVHPGTVARFPQCDAALAKIASWLRTTLGKGQCG